MSSQLSYRLHGREQRPKTRRKHYRDELDTGQVKASARAESLFRKAVGDGPQSVFCARPYGQFRGTIFGKSQRIKFSKIGLPHIYVT